MLNVDALDIWLELQGLVESLIPIEYRRLLVDDDSLNHFVVMASSTLRSLCDDCSHWFVSVYTVEWVTVPEIYFCRDVVADEIFWELGLLDTENITNLMGTLPFLDEFQQKSISELTEVHRFDPWESFNPITSDYVVYCSVKEI